MSRVVLLFIGLWCGYGVFAQVKDNETLIYYWDAHHKRNYYCQFGTSEEIKKGSFERQCFRRNKNMQYILPDGSKTHPYLSYGASVGFILKCRDIPDADLLDCTKLLYTTCTYTCKGSSVSRNATCELAGPIENVTARWSVSQPCAEDSPGHDVQPVTMLFDKSSVKLATSGEMITKTVQTVESIELSTDNTTSKPVADVENTTVDSVSGSAGYLMAFIGSAVVVVVVLVAVVVGGVICVQIWRRRKRRTPKDQMMPELFIFKEVAYTDAATVFSDSEYKQLLVAAEGEDNMQKSSDESETSTSESETKSPSISTQDVTEVSNNLMKVSSSNLIFNRADSDRDVENVKEEEFFKGYSPFSSAVDINNDGLNSAMDDFLTMNSNFSSWEKTKQLLENSKATESPIPPHPEQCCETVALLQNQSLSYRRNLRAQLEVISSRTREQALIGYMMNNWQLFGYQSENELKMHEKTFENQVEDKVSDYFLQVLTHHMVKLGPIMEYFYECRNYDAVRVILQVHTNCLFCERTKKEEEMKKKM